MRSEAFTPKIAAARDKNQNQELAKLQEEMCLAFAQIKLVPKLIDKN